jgi:amidase
VVFAKSNTPEFQAGANTFNEVFGRTLNPFDTTRSAAGSSGGAAVAVAIGMAHIAQGSDNACSVRYPASFCGIVGLRPSPGIVPKGPSPLPHQVLSVIGPLARSVADVGLGLDAMARFDPRDPRSRPSCAGSYRAAAEAPEKPAHAAFSMDMGGATRISAEVRAVVGAAMAKLAAAGIAAEEAAPDVSRSRDAFLPIRAFQFAALFRDALENHRDKLKPEVVWNIEEGLKLTAADLAAAEAARAFSRDAMVGFVARHGVLITPTAPVPPYPVEKRFVDEIDGEKLATYLDWLVLGFTVTVAGCPAISIPVRVHRRRASGRPPADRDALWRGRPAQRRGVVRGGARRRPRPAHRPPDPGLSEGAGRRRAEPVALLLAAGFFIGLIFPLGRMAGEAGIPPLGLRPRWRRPGRASSSAPLRSRARSSGCRSMRRRSATPR